MPKKFVSISYLRVPSPPLPFYCGVTNVNGSRSESVGGSGGCSNPTAER